ncbi:MAG: glycosyltransferase family A protein [Planctomycetota bacterium]
MSAKHTSTGPRLSGWSVIIAAYNRGPLIKPTLDSVLQQTVQPEEIIVVDDGSTDGTGDWVNEHFPELQVARKPNGGTSSARNHGASVATGQTLMFLDHDDLLLPNALAALARLLEVYPQASAAHCDHEYRNDDADVFHKNHHYTIPSFQRLLDTDVISNSDGERLYGYPLYRSLLWGNLLQQPWAIRKEVFEQVGGFSEDVRYCEDWDIYLRVTQRFPVVVSDEVISTHMIEGENLHLADGDKQDVMYEKVLRRRHQSHSTLSFQENRITRKKLASIEKMRGDRAKKKSLDRDAWRAYVKSFGWWPFDHVVAARLLLWLR